MFNELSEMGCVLSYTGFDLSDPEKEKVGILAIQLKERSVVHSVSFCFFFFPQHKLYFQGKHEIIFIGMFKTTINFMQEQIKDLKEEMRKYNNVLERHKILHYL